MRRSRQENLELLRQNPWTEPLLWFGLSIMLSFVWISDREPGMRLVGFAWLVAGVGWLLMTWIQIRMPRWHSALRWLPIWMMGTMLFALACLVFLFVRSIFS